jgi:hypothetical protein
MHPNLVESDARSHMDTLVREARVQQMSSSVENRRPLRNTVAAYCGRMLVRGGARLIIAAQVEPA